MNGSTLKTLEKLYHRAKIEDPRKVTERYLINEIALGQVINLFLLQ